MKTYSSLVVLAIIFCCVGNVNATTYMWIGAGAGGSGVPARDFSTAANWSPNGVPGIGDVCIMNVGKLSGQFIINVNSTITVGSLTINFEVPDTATSLRTVNFNVYSLFTISGQLVINNTCASAFNDSLMFNIGNASGSTTGTMSCGEMVIAANGQGKSNSNPNFYLNVNKLSGITCTGNWTSTAAANSYTGTYIMNYGAITINGYTNASNYGNKPVRYLVGDTTTTITFNGNTKFGVAGPNAPPSKDSSLVYTGRNQIYLGGMAPGSKGNFIFKGLYDTLGYNFGTENLKKATLLFDHAIADTQFVTSYAGSNAPDRIPGTFRVGSLNNPIVNYELGAGDNDALTISYALIVNNNSALQLSGVVTPSNANNIDPEGLVQVRAGAKLVLLTKAGKTSGVPGNYKYYNFDPSSTLEFNGRGYQTLYSGIEYGNVVISGKEDSAKTVGGSLTIKGSLTINSNRILKARFDTSSTPTIITVQGNWINNGTFNALDGTVILDSAVDRTISGANVTTFNKLVINKKGKSMLMNKNVIVDDSLKLDSGQLKVNGKTLTLKGAVTYLVGSLTGNVTGNDTSNLVLCGPAKKNLYFTPGNHTFHDVTVDTFATDVHLDDSLYIAGGLKYGTLTVHGKLKTNGWLSLRSSLLASARVGVSSGTIEDTVTVERYISPRRAWRFLAVPFAASNQTINQAWQEGAIPNPNTTPLYNPKPGYGTEITYMHGMQSLGFDENRTTNPSLYSWDPVLNNFVPVPSTYIPLTTYGGYYIFVRGDRSVNLSLGTSAPPSVTVLRAKGILNENGLDVVNNFNNVYYPAGLNLLVSNPYASPIRMLDAINRSTNIVHDKFTAWNPADTSAAYPYNVGNYVYYTNTIWAPLGTSYGGGTFAQSGQAFMVQTTGGIPNITFQQSDKDLFQADVFGLRAVSQTPAEPSAVYTNLLSVLGGKTALLDGVAAGFSHDFSADVDNADAKKLWNPAENIALMRNGQPLAIELRPMPKATDTLFYKMYLNLVPYTLQIFSQNLPKDIHGQALLVDKYLNTRTEIDLHDTTLYNFTPNADTNSYRNRFMLVYNRIRTKENKTSDNITGAGSVRVFPNPVTGETVKLQFIDMPLGDYDVTVFGPKGEQLLTRAVLQSGGNAIYSIKTNANWKPGVYTVSIINRETKKVNAIQMIVSR